MIKAATHEAITRNGEDFLAEHLHRLVTATPALSAQWTQHSGAACNNMHAAD